jgi:hypothetical protein
MNKISYAVLAAAATLTLAACGKSDSAGEAAQAENVEMPAEEAMGTVDEGAAPAADASAGAAAAADGSAPTEGASAAAEAATKDAEKKM